VVGAFGPGNGVGFDADQYDNSCVGWEWGQPCHSVTACPARLVLQGLGK
jgi:hypothetical protein